MRVLAGNLDCWCKPRELDLALQPKLVVEIKLKTQDTAKISKTLKTHSKQYRTNA